MAVNPNRALYRAAVGQPAAAPEFESDLPGGARLNNLLVRAVPRARPNARE